MKLLFSLLMIFFASGKTFSQDKYIFVGSNISGSMSMYFNKNIRKNLEQKNTYNVWVKSIFSNAGRDAGIDYLIAKKNLGESVGDYNLFSYTIELNLVNIQNFKYKRLSSVYYTMDGHIIYYINYDERIEDWKYAVPESLEESYIKKVHNFLIKK